MICPHPALTCGSGSPLPSLGEGSGVRAKSMLQTLIQQCQLSIVPILGGVGVGSGYAATATASAVAIAAPLTLIESIIKRVTS
jgi:hypothetical protein